MEIIIDVVGPILTLIGKAVKGVADGVNAVSDPIGKIVKAVTRPFKIFGFAEGGYTGYGNKYEPAGIVHKGEYVIPAWMTTKYPNLVAVVEKIRARGYANGGLVGGVLSLNDIDNKDILLEILNSTKETAKILKRLSDGDSLSVRVV